jgi:hypothetical protein
MISGSNAGTTTLAALTVTGALTAGTNAIPWNASWDTEVQSECDDAITLNALVLDLPTTAEFNARSLVSADYTIVSDLGVVQTADHTAAIADIPTVAEFNARSLVSADYTIVSDLGVVQTGDSYAIVNGDHGLVSVQDDVDTLLTRLTDTRATYLDYLFSIYMGLVSSVNQATAGAAGSITLAAGASAVNDFYKGQIIVIYTGTGAGQARACYAYNGATKVASIRPNWATNPDATSWYVITTYGSSVIAAMENDTITAASLNADAGTELAAAIWAKTGAVTALSVELVLERVYEMINNKMIVTEATGAVALRNLADGADVATGNVQDLGATTQRNALTWA